MSKDWPLFGKYIVERADGRDKPGEKHAGCNYFVLDLTHDSHAVPALRAYVVACEQTHPVLANDLRAKLAELEAAAQEEKRE